MAEFVAGNFEDKYRTKNPISKVLVTNFLNTFEDLLVSLPDKESIKSICEVGVGEGELLKIVARIFPKAKLFATDLAKNEIRKANTNLSNLAVSFSVQNAENLKKYRDRSFDLVICCEVLEHATDPCRVLMELKRISHKHILVSVPNEPVWRWLNLLRGKYFSAGGNTPGHLNHWSPGLFRKFLNQGRVKIRAEKFPFPWQMKLLSPAQISASCPRRQYCGSRTGKTNSQTTLSSSGISYPYFS